MNNSAFEVLKDYADAELIPRFYEEYKEHQKLADCPSYEQVKALCKALNALLPYAQGYAGYIDKVTPMFIIEKYREAKHGDQI